MRTEASALTRTLKQRLHTHSHTTIVIVRPSSTPISGTIELVCAWGKWWSDWMLHLEKPGEDVELKDGDVVVAGEVDGGFESHGL